MSDVAKRVKASLQRAIHKDRKRKPKRTDSYHKGRPGVIVGPTAEQRTLATIRAVPDQVYIKGSVEKFRAKTPKQVKDVVSTIIKQHAEQYEQDQLEQQRRDQAHEKSEKERLSPMYQIALTATYGLGGSFHGSRGRSPTGQEMFEKCRKYPKSTWLEFIKNLQDGDIPKPLQSYTQNYIQKTVDWAVSVVATME